MKKCPWCAEEIQDDAIVCKHCGRDLDEGRSQDITADPRSLAASDDLEKEVRRYTAHNFRVVSRAEGSVRMERGGIIDSGLVVAFILTLWPAAIIYMIIAAVKKYRVELAVSPNGAISESGDALLDFMRDQDRIGQIKKLVWVVFWLIMLGACLYGAFAGTGAR
jgi:hypothetical protein